MAATSSMSTPPSVEAMTARRPTLAVEGHAEVELARDPAALLDVDLADLLPLGAGLRGLEHHAEHRLGVGARLVGRAGELHAAALPAAAGVDLGLHGADAAAELAGGALGLERRDREVAARHGDAELPEDLLRLVLVDLHRAPRSFRASRGGIAPPAGRPRGAPDAGLLARRAAAGPSRARRVRRGLQPRLGHRLLHATRRTSRASPSPRR